MGIFQTVRDWFMDLFKREAESKFHTDIIQSAQMEYEQKKWANIIDGKPPWLDVKDGVETINFAKFISYYCAKKICLDINVKVEGSERADYIQKCVSAMLKKSIRDKVEDACNCGGIIFKPNVVLDHEYTSFVLGEGSIEYTNCGVKTPSEIERDALKNGGESTLVTRQRKVFAPYGISWKTNSIISPTDAQLENGANWEIANSNEGTKKYYPIKAIAIAQIKSRG